MDLSKLNKEQVEAVKHIDGPMLVLAGAGSGKTKVLTNRIAYLIENGINEQNILAITFTNKAAREMRERLELLEPNNNAFVGTFHSFGVRIIRENALTFLSWTILATDSNTFFDGLIGLCLKIENTFSQSQLHSNECNCEANSSTSFHEYVRYSFCNLS